MLFSDLSCAIPYLAYVTNGVILPETTDVSISERILSPPASIDYERVFVPAWRKRDAHCPYIIPVIIGERRRLPIIEVSDDTNIVRASSGHDKEDLVPCMTGGNRPFWCSRDSIESRCVVGEEDPHHEEDGRSSRARQTVRYAPRASEQTTLLGWQAGLSAGVGQRFR